MCPASRDSRICPCFALTIVTVVHIDLSVGVHVVGLVCGTGNGGFRRKLRVSIMQLLHWPGNGCRAPAGSVAVTGVDRRRQGNYGYVGSW